MNQPLSGKTLPLLFTLILITCAGCKPQSQTDEVMALAAVHRSNGEYTAAESDYTQLLDDVEEPDPALALADLYIQWNRPALGLTALDTALARGISSTEVVTRQLELLLLDRQWQQVVDLSRTHLVNYPENIAALQALTTAALHLNNCAEARVTSEKLWLADNEDMIAAMTYSILNENPTVLCESTPDLCRMAAGCDGLCRMDIGLTLIEDNAWSLASCILDRAVASDPDNSLAHTWLGETLSRINQQQAAEKHLTTAVALDQTNPLGWLLLGGHALRNGDWETARAALLNAHHLDPENPAPCLTIAELKASQSLYTEVDTWIKAALERAVNDIDVWKVAARIYLIRNLVQSDMPEWIANSAIHLNPQDAEAHLLLGWAFMLKGNTDQALAEIDAAITLDPALGQAFYFRGVLMEEANNPEESDLAFIRAADLGYFP